MNMFGYSFVSINLRMPHSIMDDNGWGSTWGSRDPGFLSSDDADAGDADADSAGDADTEEKKGILVSYSNVHLWLDLNTYN